MNNPVTVRGPDFTPENEAADEQRMVAREPMSALRDLICLCEQTIGTDDPEAQAILSRAQTAFDSLRKIFGDNRPAEDVAFGPMVEPDDLVDAFQATAGALQCVAKLLPNREQHMVRFTSLWSRFGIQSVGNILNRANQALGFQPAQICAPGDKAEA